MDVRRYLATRTAGFLFTPDAEFPVCCGEKGCVNAEVSRAVDRDGVIIAFWRRGEKRRSRACRGRLVDGRA